jgi:hypothetical protein
MVEADHSNLAGVLSGQCLDRRIPDKLTLAEEVAAWEDSRNKKHVKSRLALHHRRCPRKTEEVVSRNMSDSGH